MFRSNVPSKIGIFARVRAGKRKKKKWWTDRTTTLQRFNRDTLLFVRVYAPCPVTRNTKISPSRASSQQLTSNARRAIFYFSLPLRKTTTTRKYFPKNAAILPSKDLLFPRSARDFNIRLASKSSCEKREFRAHSPLR